VLKAEQAIIDAEFEVISGPLRQGDRHPKRRSWIFTGRYDAAGDPLFYNRLLDVGWWMGVGQRICAWAVGIMLGALAIMLAVALMGYATGRVH
jgi:hypothetical protein